jgi:hypothetical protein
MRTQNKNSDNSHFGYKLYITIDRNYQQIRRFKTTTVSFHDCQVDYQKKMKWSTETEDPLEQNHKVMMQRRKEQ